MTFIKKKKVKRQAQAWRKCLQPTFPTKDKYLEYTVSS